MSSGHAIGHVTNTEKMQWQSHYAMHRFCFIFERLRVDFERISMY